MKKIVLFLITICVAVSMGATNKTFTLVIDAGHGGHDAGAIGKGKVKEKDLTLKFALAFGQMVERNCPDVKVVYTRKTDRFVELYRRAEIANQNKADLFISVHINSVDRGTVRGFQTYTLGRSRRTGKKTGVVENLEVAKRENAVILMEKDYKQTYQGYDPNSPESDIMFEFIQDKNMENSVELAKYMQRYVCQATGRQNMGAHQDNLAVLRLTSMPGCLIELGFISTRDEEQYMNSSQATGQYARGIFNAFQAYRKRHGGNIVIPYQADTTKDEVIIPQIVPDSEKKASENNQRQAKQKPQVENKKVEEKADSTVQQPATETEEKPIAQPEAPVFKVQIFASSGKLEAGDAHFKGLDGVDSYQEGGMYKYTVGASTDYHEIYRKRKEIADKFPQAFIVAFRSGDRMDLNEAIREFKRQKETGK